MTEKEMLYGLSHLNFLTADKFDRMLEMEGSIEAIYNVVGSSCSDCKVIITTWICCGPSMIFANFECVSGFSQGLIHHQ